MAIFACRIDTQKGIFDNQCFKFLIKFDAVALAQKAWDLVIRDKFTTFAVIGTISLI